MKKSGNFYNLYGTREIFDKHLKENGFILREIGGTGNTKININYSDHLFGEIFYSRILALYNLDEKQGNEIIKKAFEKLELIVDNWDVDKKIE